jgi:hypothetical protein
MNNERLDAALASIYPTERSGEAVQRPLPSPSLYYCDCCGAPMVNVSHYGADCSAGCETSACLICSNQGPAGLHVTKLEILAEIVDLGRHWNEDKVVERILQLGDQIAKVKS